MDDVQETAQLGLHVDSTRGNTFLQYYAASGTVPLMEVAYRRLKKSTMVGARSETLENRRKRGGGGKPTFQVG